MGGATTLTTTVATRKVVGYARVSTAHQAGELHSSLETQEARYREYCERQGLTPVGLFTDVVSGRRDDRKEYLRMVEFVTGGGADTIVVQFLDRFGRNPREILRRYWDLEERGIEIIATDEDIKEELMLLIKAGMAGAESRRTSERVRAYMGKAVEKGVHFGRPPYGYRPIRRVGGVLWEQDPDEAPIVRQMYRLAVEENRGYKGIGDQLSAQGYRARGGRAFTSYTIQMVLNNEALKGDLVYGKKPKKGNPPRELVRVEGFFPAILTDGEWERLQDRFAIRREYARGQTHASDYLLSGIARCGQCGGPMVGKVGSTYKGRRYRNYWCSRAQASRERCATYNGHAAPKLEQAILEHLGQYTDLKRVRELLAESTERNSKTIETELRRVSRRLAQLEADFLKNLDLLKRGVLNEEEFTKANEVRRDERSTLEASKAEMEQQVAQDRDKRQAAESVPAKVRSLMEDFQQLEVRPQKARLQELLKAAHVHRDGRIELEFRV